MMRPTGRVTRDGGALDQLALQTVASRGRAALAWEILRRDPRYVAAYSEGHLVDRQTFKERRSAALAEWQMVAS